MEPCGYVDVASRCLCTAVGCLGRCRGGRERRVDVPQLLAHNGRLVRRPRALTCPQCRQTSQEPCGRGRARQRGRLRRWSVVLASPRGARVSYIAGTRISTSGLFLPRVKIIFNASTTYGTMRLRRCGLSLLPKQQMGTWCCSGGRERGVE